MSLAESLRHLLKPFRWYIAPRADGESVILWWEKRRLLYNLLVFLSTLPFCLFLDLYAMGLLRTSTTVQQMYDSQGDMKLLVQALLQIMCNVWYTGGWMVELIVRLIPGKKMRWFGPIALIAGTVFSFLFVALWLRGWGPGSWSFWGSP
ncbi:MAG: hypothetical protein WBE72_00695 [Terracidiphilus sp.]